MKNKTGQRNSKVSIIIPVYNTVSYLADCLGSVVDQSLADIEIIIVDDASGDGSRSIVQKYAKQDRRIKTILFKQNKGAGIARNVGLQAARGQYVLFVDSDDMLCSDAAKKLYDEAQAQQLDILEGRFVSLRGKSIHCYDRNALMWPAAWLRLWRREFLIEHKLKFSDGVCAEDGFFCLKAYLLAGKTAEVPFVFYQYRISKNTRSTKLFSEAAYASVMIVIRELDMNRMKPLLKRQRTVVRKLLLFFILYEITRGAFSGEVSEKMRLKCLAILCYYQSFLQKNMPQKNLCLGKKELFVRLGVFSSLSFWSAAYRLLKKYFLLFCNINKRQE